MLTPASSRRRARGELHPGQECGDSGVRCRGELLDICLGQKGAVVDARGAHLDREAHARTVAQLVAVHSQAETCIPTG